MISIVFPGRLADVTDLKRVTGRLGALPSNANDRTLSGDVGEKRENDRETEKRDRDGERGSERDREIKREREIERRETQRQTERGRIQGEMVCDAEEVEKERKKRGLQLCNRNTRSPRE